MSTRTFPCWVVHWIEAFHTLFVAQRDSFDDDDDSDFDDSSSDPSDTETESSSESEAEDGEGKPKLSRYQRMRTREFWLKKPSDKDDDIDTNKKHQVR